MKANAYGHGLVQTARSLASAEIPGLSLGVFMPDEAISLREAGISEPILLLGPSAETDIELLVHEDVEIALLDACDARPIGRAHANVHVKIETGTHRFGLRRDQVGALARELYDAGARVVGVYSHLADSEELDAAFAREQLARLLDAAEAVGTATGSRPQRHIAASAAAILWPEFRLDLVRGGIALYGLWPSAGVRDRMREVDPSFVLEPALRWFAPVAHISEVAAGETVGYGCEFTCKRASRIAVLALGYADGLPRAAGNERGRVRFGKSDAPIVGRVCMNACMVDVTDIAPPVQRGDAAELNVEDIAAAANTISYEILARLPNDSERRYT